MGEAGQQTTLREFEVTAGTVFELGDMIIKVKVEKGWQ